MFHSLRLLRSFRIPAAVLRSFASDVASLYPDNPFHNSAHALSVTHATWMLLRTGGFRPALLADLDVLALMLSALCHDVEHPVRTSFLVAAQRAG